MRQLPHAGENNQRVVRHLSQVARDEPVHSPPKLKIRFDCSRVCQHGVSRVGAVVVVFSDIHKVFMATSAVVVVEWLIIILKD